MCVRVFFTAGFAREGKEEGLFRLGWRAEASEGQRGSCFVLSFIGGSCLSSTGGDQQSTLRTYTGASTLRVRTHMRPQSSECTNEGSRRRLSGREASQVAEQTSTPSRAATAGKDGG